MATGDMTVTDYGTMSISAAALLVDAGNLPAATDWYQIIPTGNTGRVAVLKCVRAS